MDPSYIDNQIEKTHPFIMPKRTLKQLFHQTQDEILCMEIHFCKLHIMADITAETRKHLQPCCTHQDIEVTPHLLSHFVPFKINYTASTL